MRKNPKKVKSNKNPPGGEGNCRSDAFFCFLRESDAFLVYCFALFVSTLKRNFSSAASLPWAFAMFPRLPDDSPPGQKNEPDFTECAERLKALAEPIRLRIASYLIAGPKTVGEIAAALSEDVVKISHHLGILRNAEILNATKEGRFVRYGLGADIIQLGQNMLGGQIDFGCCRVRVEQIDQNTT